MGTEHMLSLIIPVYKNEKNVPDLLQAVARLKQRVAKDFEAVFVVDGSPDRCFELLRDQLPQQQFKSQLILLSRNFGSFAAIRAGLLHAKGNHFAVMAADLQEPPELILEMADVLFKDRADVVVGVRDSREDPILSGLAARVFWWCYRRYVVPEMPLGGVDIFACNKAFRDSLLKLEERHSSLVAQVFWLGFRRSEVSYARRKRVHGKSAWTFKKKMNYLMDSVFAFTDLPIRLVLRIGIVGALLSIVFGSVVAVARLAGAIAVPGYAATMIVITLLGSLNLLGLGVVGSYAWRAYENTKQRPIAITLNVSSYQGMSHGEHG